MNPHEKKLIGNEAKIKKQENQKKRRVEMFAFV